jgi:hypothetical protein
MRVFGSDSASDPVFSREIVDEVWLLAVPIAGNDDALWRCDEHGNRIQRQDYGKHGSPFGWGISEPRPGCLKPLHWRSLAEAPGSPDSEQDGLFTDTPELF